MGLKEQNRDALRVSKERPHTVWILSDPFRQRAEHLIDDHVRRLDFGLNYAASDAVVLMRDPAADEGADPRDHVLAFSFSPAGS